MYRSLTTYFVLFAIALASSMTVSAQSGSLDPAFGSGGIALVNIPGVTSSEARKLAVQPDGKIVVLSQGHILFRLNTDGSTDASFGSGGFVYCVWPTGLAASSRTLALQSNGRVVVAGSVPAPRGSAMRFQRYNADGSADDGSGTDSTPSDVFGVGGASTVHEGTALSMVTLSDDRILAMSNDGSLVRLSPNGSLDSTFGSSGIAKSKVAFSPGLNGLVILTNGRIAAAGTFTSGNTGSFAVVGYNTNGSPDDGSRNDTTKTDVFGSAGKILVSFSGYPGGSARAMKLDAIGRLVIVGAAGQASTGATGIARLTATGQLDSTFGTSGRSVVTIPDGNIFASGLGIQPDGRIVVIGGVYRSGDNDAAIYQFNSDGSPDTFGGVSVVTTDVAGIDDVGRDGVLRTDPACGCERILWMGSTFDRISVWTPALIQYLP